MTQEITSGKQAALSVIHKCLVATIQGDLYDDLLLRTRNAILNQIHASSIHGVIFDMSSVGMLDSFMFNHLAETARMTMLLGAKSVFVAFQSGTVSSLIDVDVDLTDITSFRTMEEGISYLLTNFGPKDPGTDREESDSAILDNEVG